MTFKKFMNTSLLCMALVITSANADDVTIGDLSARLDDLEKRTKGENPAGDELATKNDVESLANLVKSLTGRIEILEHQLGKTSQVKHGVDADDSTAADPLAKPAAQMEDSELMEPSSALEAEDADVDAILESLGSKAKPQAPSPKEKVTENREKATQTAEKNATSTLDAGSSAAGFDQAKGLMNKAQYAEAEASFKHYLTEHPSGKEAAAARVQLGEAQLKQGKKSEAKASFAKAYKANSKGTEGAKALLGLGETLGATDKDKKSACTVLKKLKSDFPNNKETNAKADGLITKYKCS
ncbi:tetratricopeptide repeat protein [Candidatus Paracaedibacter symbiosus]|uniref:tetratricopeptide repeat protein n=1 Tax=Candidatus Paracaedibacter symbiosus TaxID=244582 RepID=UPI0005094E54|nr:tetratricopeptide repeat protein [Candidatus Paracaedibacter symbiosus]